MGIQRIVPNVWCQRNAEEAGRFYAETLPHTSATISSRYPTEGLAEFQRDFAGAPLTVTLDVDGYEIVLINAGGGVSPGGCAVVHAEL